MLVLHWTALLLSLNSKCFAASYLDEIRLRDDILMNHNPTVRPKLNLSEPVHLGAKLFIRSVDDLDEKSQVVTSSVYFEIVWKNELLFWNETEYNGIESILVSPECIWLPDLYLSGAVEDFKNIGGNDVKVNLDSDGTVMWWPGKVIKTYCPVDVRKYPFDVQMCPFQIGMWSSHDDKVKPYYLPAAKLIDLTFLDKNGEWDISSERDTDNLLYEGMTHLGWKLVLKRKSLFYVINIILPLTSLTILNLLCYLVPDASGEKLTLSISIFLSYIVFLTLISNSMPTSSEHIPVLGIVLIFNLFQSGVTIFLSVVSLNLYHGNLRSPSVTCSQCFRLKNPPRDERKRNGDKSENNEDEFFRENVRLDSIYFPEKSKRFSTVCFIISVSVVSISWLTFIIILTL